MTSRGYMSLTAMDHVRLPNAKAGLGSLDPTLTVHHLPDYHYHAGLSDLLQPGAASSRIGAANAASAPGAESRRVSALSIGAGRHAPRLLPRGRLAQPPGGRRFLGVHPMPSCALRWAGYNDRCMQCFVLQMPSKRRWIDAKDRLDRAGCQSDWPDAG